MPNTKGFYKEGGKSKPITEKKGMTEEQMNVSVKGSNDTIKINLPFTKIEIPTKYHDVDSSKKLSQKDLKKFMSSDVFKKFMSRYKVDEENDQIIFDGQPYTFEQNYSPPYIAIDNVNTGNTVYFTQDEGVSNLEKDAGSLEPEIVFYYLDSAGVFQN